MSTLVPVAPERIRARRRIGAITWMFAWELACGLVVATPIHAWARRVWGAHPDGDATLFRPGGRDLLAWLDTTDPAMAVTGRTVLILLVVTAIASQLPLGALLASLGFERDDAGPPRARMAMQAAVSMFLPLSGLLVLGSLAELVVVGIGLFASSAVDHGLSTNLGDARSFLLRLTTLGLFLLVACVIGVFVDLARAAVGRQAGAGRDAPGWTMMLRGLARALSAARGRLARATVAWGWRAAGAAALVGAGSFAASALGGRGGVALVALFVAHQAVVFGRVALRASWLARATAMVAVDESRTETRPAEIATSPATSPELQRDDQRDESER